jgi:glycosyltransferase involved in cell wall biosynthesis
MAPESQHPSRLTAITGGLLLGGSTTFLLNLASGFQELGEGLQLITLSESNEMAADFQSMGVEPETVKASELIYEDRLLMAYRWTAARRPQAVLACLGSDSFEVLRLVPPGVVRMAVVQSDDPAPYALMRDFSQWIDVAVGVSPRITDRFQQMPELKRSKIACIPYGIRIPTAARTPRPDGTPIRIIYLGRLIEEQKRVSRLVELAQELERRGLAYEFTIAGTGPEAGGLHQRLETIPRVKFLGDVPNQQVPGLLRQQDVMVLLSDYEGLPVSLLEAMGSGVVPVVSDLQSGIRELVTDATGIRVGIGDVRAAADAIGVLNEDRIRLDALGQAAREQVSSHYSAKRMAERYLELVPPCSTAASSTIDWPAEIDIPRPLGVSPAWAFQGAGRRLRRLAKMVFRQFTSEPHRPSSRR